MRLKRDDIEDTNAVRRAATSRQGDKQAKERGRQGAFVSPWRRKIDVMGASGLLRVVRLRASLGKRNPKCVMDLEVGTGHGLLAGVLGPPVPSGETRRSDPAFFR